jgi:hypothetical protein
MTVCHNLLGAVGTGCPEYVILHSCPKTDSSQYFVELSDYGSSEAGVDLFRAQFGDRLRKLIET